MKLKSEAMYFEIKKGTTKPSGYIRNSYREGGKVKHQTISRINGLSYVQLQDMKAAFDGKTINRDDIKVADGREYGASWLLCELAKKIGLDKAIYSRNEEWVKCTLAMIIGRIVYQGSKWALSRISKVSCLWEVCGITDIDINVDKHCYNAMDELISRQDLIQKKLVNKHLADGSVILYDITSSYFEGEYEDSDIAKFGYNRDKKRGKKQIVIALLTTRKGCPVAVEVFAGNTSDSTTVQDKIAEIRNKYGVKNFVFVGDRGMLTQKNLGLLENDESLKDIVSVTALTHATMRTLCEEKGVQLSLFDKDTAIEVVLPEEPGVRYALKLNPKRAEDSRKTRDTLIQKTEDSLADIAIPKKKTDDKTLASRATKVFVKYKTEKYFDWNIADNKIVYSRKVDVIEREQLYDGHYVIRSNVSKELMDITEVADTYKSLINIEQAFRDIKTVQLEIRPMYHRIDERIKSHVFICTLSYYLLWHLNKALKPLLETDDFAGTTQNEVIEIMKSLQKCKLSIGDTHTTIVAEPTQLQHQIQNMALGDSL